LRKTLLAKTRGAKVKTQVMIISWILHLTEQKFSFAGPFVAFQNSFLMLLCIITILGLGLM